MRNKKATKEKIIRSAVKLFVQKGFLKVSTLDISKKADIAHGTLFFHFRTRSDLIIACIYTVMEKLAKDLNETSRDSDNIEILCKIFINQINKHRKFYSQLIKDLPHLLIDTQRMVFASLSGFSVHFIETIEKAQSKKKIRKFEPKYAMFFWFGVINYLFTYSQMLGVKKIKQKEQKELTNFLMASLTNINY